MVTIEGEASGSRTKSKKGIVCPLVKDDNGALIFRPRGHQLRDVPAHSIFQVQSPQILTIKFEGYGQIHIPLCDCLICNSSFERPIIKVIPNKRALDKN